MKATLGGNKKLLLCDRDPALLSLYQRGLRAEGYEVVCASSGEDALQRVPREHPDLVVIEDWIATPGNGETMDRILKEDGALPVVLISGHAPLGEDFSLWLADGWVVKSSDLTELKAVIERILSTKASGKNERSLELCNMTEAVDVPS